MVPSKGCEVSWEAKRWAEKQNLGDPNLRYVLIGACEFSNKRNGEIYASAAAIADWCNYNNRGRVSSWLKKLQTMGFLIDTGKRVGVSTVYLPSYWSKSETAVSRERDGSETAVSRECADNGSPVIGKVGAEPITYNPKPRTIDEFHTLGNSINGEKRTREARSISSFLDNESFKSAEPSPEAKLFEEFQAYCFKRGGQPTKKGFKTWKLTQANRHKGYLVEGKFLTEKQANEKARNDPELICKMRKATRINGKITIL